MPKQTAGPKTFDDAPCQLHFLAGGTEVHRSLHVTLKGSEPAVVGVATCLLVVLSPFVFPDNSAMGYIILIFSFHHFGFYFSNVLYII